MRSPPPVPPLRDDIMAKKHGERVVVEDPLRRLRIGVDELTVLVMQALADGPVEPDALAAAINAPRIEIQRRVELLCRQALLETPRARDQVELYEALAAAEAVSEAAADGASLGQEPLRFHGKLAHGCVACGGCCHGTDVGPLKDDDVARIEAVDWGPLLPADVAREDWIEEIPAERSPTRRPIRLMGRRHGRCIFLDRDKLCIIHKHRGAAHKPTICRQFPYTFTRTPKGIDVSFSTECRAWWRARNNAVAPSEDAAQVAAIRGLLSEGAPVITLAGPLAVATGVDIDLEMWEALREAMIAGVEGAESVGALAMAVVTPLASALDRLSERYRDSELFASRAAFSLPDPDPSDQARRFFETVARLRSALGAGLAALADEMRAAGERDDADRTRRVAWGLDELLGGRDLGDLVPFEHDLEIWRDLALASLQGHEPARRGDLALGVATLALKLRLGPMLAGLSAQTALRGRVTEQEVVDAMVLVTKLLRGSAFERLLAGSRRDLVAVFVCDAATLVEGRAPRPLPPWL